MKIESSTLSLSAISSQKKTYNVSEQLKIWSDGSEPQPDTPSNLLKDFYNDLSKPTQIIPASDVGDEFLFELSEEDEAKLSLLERMIEALTGKKLRFYVPRKFQRREMETQIAYKNPMMEQVATPQKKGWGINYQKSERIEENSSMNFQAQGQVKTANGKTINIDLNLNVSSSFISQTTTSFKAGDALIDPLVINFANPSTELTSRKFDFDIDSDGKKDNISFVKSGSGFLVFDKNKDGKIGNGSELFGPSTGDGFMELQAYDNDGNGWIDEQDPIYERLQIWTKDENGVDQLLALGQRGIGAIYLHAVASNFELKNTDNIMQ